MDLRQNLIISESNQDDQHLIMWLMFVALPYTAWPVLPPAQSWPTGSGAGRETGATSIGSAARGWGKEARGLGGALGPVTVYYNTFSAAWLEIGGAVMGPRTWAPSRQPSWRWAGTTVT